MKHECEYRCQHALDIILNGKKRPILVEDAHYRHSRTNFMGVYYLICMDAMDGGKMPVVAWLRQYLGL
jgi:hypothetical protein